MAIDRSTLPSPDLRAADSVAPRGVAGLQAGLGGRLIAVVLFGSRARGDSSDDSDWDLLLIADELPLHALERHLFVKRLLPDEVRSRIAVIAKTPAEFESHLPALYLDVATDGRILHDPHGYAAERLTALRRIIEKSGLYRRRTPAGDVWEWRSPPRGPWSLRWDS